MQTLGLATGKCPDADWEAIPRAVRIRVRIQFKVEIDDHKMYYDKRALWPILVRAGFKPSQIRLQYHKFGLNLFAAARKDGQHN